MTDEELREAFTSLLAALRETNASIKQTNVRLAYTEGEVLADRERTRRLEASFQMLIELTRNMDARLDTALKQQEVAERRAEAMERRADLMEQRTDAMERRAEVVERRADTSESRQSAVEEALASLTRTVERYINARSTNGNKSE